MRMILGAALLATTAVASPAFAQSAAGPFAGPRVEGIVGYDNAKIPGPNSDGVVYGGGIGYDIQSGGTVYGVEAELSDSTVDECSPNVIVAGDTLCGQIGRDIYVGARAGAVVGANTLLYAKAGYVNGRVQLDYDDGTAANTTGYETGRNLDGVRVGAGVEHAIGPNSYIKAEYRYSNYEQDIEKHQAVAGFGFRF
ncbi:outer membrane protein [Allosphingosinicella indica]|uniref:Outer membrane immunogenic protein n=1 Tax=Allosphingosinicella indica TaxID=941907 RepID=A0A1X7GA31_9SPHN|nr:porin family protein [Allosphingosinicella indica]SMF66587.1 outer membrane immunogenic protein [Allosphingosinicella indica]